MDRNRQRETGSLFFLGVALRKESVDRNCTMQIVIVVMSTSLSARRAWIEMRASLMLIYGFCEVALRKESVDRNRQRETGSVK